MAGIEINTMFTLSGMPNKTPKAKLIAALPSLKLWAQADPSAVTVSGTEITKFADKGGSAASFDPVATARRATLAPGALGAFSAALFKGTSTSTDGSTDCYQASGVTLAADSPYTYFAVFKPTNAADQDVILSRFTSSTVRALLAIEVDTGKVMFNHGTAAAIKVTIAMNQWHYAIASFDGTTLKLNVDGVDAASVGAAGSTGSADIILGALTASGGQAFDGYIADAAVFSESILGDPTKKALLIDFCKYAYGI